MTTESKLDLLDAILDSLCEYRGVSETVRYLLDFGLTKEDLIDLKFNSGLIDLVLEHKLI